MAGPAVAQTGAPEAPEWHPAARSEPQPLPPAFQRAASADLKIPNLIRLAQAPPTPAAKQPRPVDQIPDPVTEKKTGAVGAPVGMRNRASEDEGEFLVRTEPPGLDVLTRRVSEEQFYEILRQEARRRPGLGRIYFPEEEPVSTEPYSGRRSPYMVRFVEPYYVCHGRLYFEQINSERYGWDLGIVAPAVELGVYFYDLVMLPYHIGANTCHCYDCSSGKCLPGDAVPLLFYPEQFSITGLVFEAGAVLGGAFALH